MAVLPSEIPTGLVTGQFYFVNEDNVDAGTDPDLTVVTGKVTFTCSAGVLRMPTKLATVIPMTFDAEFNTNGELVPKGMPSQIGLKLPATDSTLFNPTGFVWKVEFDLREAATGYTVIIPSFNIQVPVGGTVDLTSAMPVDTTPGTITIQGPPGTNGSNGAPGGVDKWTANTAYAANKYALSPLGAVMYSKTARTSGSTFDMTEQANWQFQGIPYRGWLPIGTDLDTMKDGYEGLWSMPSATYTDSYSNWPSIIPRNPGQMLVLGSVISGSTIIWTHDIKTYGNTTNGNRHVERITASAVAWNNWKELGATVAPAPTPSTTAKGLSNQSFRDRFASRRGGRIGTNGVAAVALRFDHGAVNFRDKVLPKLVELGLPSSLAVNPGAGRLALAENAGVSWADYADWSLNKGVEIVDHGMDHADASDTAGLTTQLVDSKPILQTNIPAQAIELFAVPGVGGTNMNGWTSTNTPEHFTEAYEAARLVLGCHAYSTGYGYGIYRNIDGVPMNGETHYTLDAATTSDATTRIQIAQGIGAGLQLMLHPSQIDTAGNITTAIVHEILTWIAAERDAGRLVVLTLGGLLLADKTTAYRDNLVRGADFVNLSQFAGTSGWTAGGGYATSTNTAGLLTQSIDGTNRAYAAGAPRMLTAMFTSPEGAVARLSLTHAGTGLSVSKDVTLAAGVPQTVYLPFTFPIGGTVLPLSVGRVSGGTLKVENLGVFAH